METKDTSGAGCCKGLENNGSGELKRGSAEKNGLEASNREGQSPLNAVEQNIQDNIYLNVNS